MSDQEKREQEIMNQEMNLDEMETVAGGICIAALGRNDYCNSHSSEKYERPLYNPDGSINCAATVEDGSWCGSNDACYYDEAKYFGMRDCEKAWK